MVIIVMVIVVMRIVIIIRIVVVIIIIIVAPVLPADPRGAWRNLKTQCVRLVCVLLFEFD